MGTSSVLEELVLWRCVVSALFLYPSRFLGQNVCVLQALTLKAFARAAGSHTVCVQHWPRTHRVRLGPWLLAARLRPLAPNLSGSSSFICFFYGSSLITNLSDSMGCTRTHPRDAGMLLSGQACVKELTVCKARLSLPGCSSLSLLLK